MSKNVVGINGSITLPSGYNMKVATWSGQYSVETADYTDFESKGWREHEPTIQNFLGSFGGHVQRNAANTAPIPAALVDGAVLATTELEDNCKGTVTLQADTGCTFSGTAIITGLNFSRSVDGKFEVTGDFLFTGPVTQAWDETSG